MARGRMISYSVSTDKRFNALSTQAALVFLMTVPHLDRDGLILADACIIAGQICPRREDVTPLVADGILQEWKSQGMVIAYEGDDGTILFFTGFAKNQVGMRYDREPKSTLPVPPGYTRTKEGLELNEVLPNTPKVPPTNGSVPPVDGNLPANNRQPADNLPPERTRAEVEVEVEEKRRGDRARATKPPPTKPAPPPPVVPLASLPGVRTPRWNQDKRDCDMFMVEAGKLGIGAEPFRLMVDTILSATGKTALANTSGEQGQKTLNAAKQTVIDLVEMDRRTLEDVQEVLTSWRENDYRGVSPPTFAQIVEHASAMAAGTHVTKRSQSSGKKDFSSLADYNEWAIVHDPQYKRIREGILVKGTTVKRADYRPELVH